MPVCEEKKILFIHPPKCGGKTVENALGLNSLDDPMRGGRNYYSRSLPSRTGRLLIKKFPVTDARKKLGGTLDLAFGASHFTLSEIDGFRLTNDPISQYLKISIARDPAERLLSIFHHVTPPPHSKVKFQFFMDSWLSRRRNAYTDAGVLALAREQSEFWINKWGLFDIDFMLDLGDLNSSLSQLRKDVAVNPDEQNPEGKNFSASRVESYLTEVHREALEKYFPVDTKIFPILKNYVSKPIDRNKKQELTDTLRRMIDEFR